MADDIESRREARRRKILENAENRLRKITNLPPKQEEKIKNNLIFSNTDISSHLRLHKYESLPRNNADNDQGTHQEDDIHHNSFEALNLSYRDNEMNRERSEISVKDGVTQAPIKHKWTYKWIIALAFMYRLLLFMLETLVTNYSNHLNKIFVPFVLYEIVEIIFNRNDSNDSISILTNIIALSNMNNPQIQKALFTLQMISRILRDMFVYFYAFVAIDYIVNW